MKHRFISKGNTTGATNDIRNYESTDETNKYVTHDVIMMVRRTWPMTIVHV